MTEQIQKALTTVALNRETTFNYQRSDAGAKGIAQIMPASHRLMRNEYPEALSSVVGNPNFYHSEFEHAAGNEQQSLRFMMMHLVDQGKQLQ